MEPMYTRFEPATCVLASTKRRIFVAKQAGWEDSNDLCIIQ